MLLSSLCAVVLCGAGVLPVWEFDNESDKSAWQPNVHIADVRLEGGALCGKTINWDPMFICEGLEIPATPWQYVLLRIKADHPGTGQLFWTGQSEGQYGGITEQKVTNFTVGDSTEFQEIAIVPGWHREGTIRKLRLDLYDGMTFAIDSIRVLDWSAGVAPEGDKTAWSGADIAQWPKIAGEKAQFSPPLALGLGNLGWTVLELESPTPAQGEFLWISDSSQGIQSESFDIRPGRRSYNIELGGHPCWKGLAQAVGIRISAPEVKTVSLALAELPGGAADLVVNYFGFENGVNRVGQACSVIAQITNQGGEKASLAGYRLTAMDAGVKIVPLTDPSSLSPLDYGNTKELRWQAQIDPPGEYVLLLDGPGLDKPMQALCRFLPPVSVQKADYVPVPVPVKPALDVCMYYFPGWESATKWDCIRKTAPIRKPLLGYYDESNVECVDWQIKWAVENGVNCFLVDWYWCAGAQYLTHWFEAYRKARYRDQLDVAIMWANHNGPGTHSRDDWRRVTKEWIERYFNLPAYYRINNKPAIFLWNPEGLRKDLGGSEAVKAALDESQDMARKAGYEGIEFVAMSGHHTTELAETLAKEGFSGATNYHEWGQAETLASSRNAVKYSDAVATAPKAWQKSAARCAPGLVYYPVVETGWDNRPWAGSKALVIGGRTAPLFEDLLRAGRTFSESHKLPMVILAPANEWGEGSYVEPATEYGFDMYEAIRRAFGTGDPVTWPVNYSPRDFALGPYDFPLIPYKGDWTFDSGKEGWSEMMNTSPAVATNGVLSFQTLGTDPALVVSTPGLNAGEFPKVLIRMRITGPEGQKGGAQLFWSAAGSATSESSSIRFPLQIDGQFHDYLVDLSQNRRWRGNISALRFDPADFQGANIDIDRVAFQRK